jgi:hypothetical protein
LSVSTAILEPSADDTLHRPLPEAWPRLPVRIKAEMESTKSAAKSGLWKNLPGTFWMAPDFDAPLDDFKEYME